MTSTFHGITSPWPPADWCGYSFSTGAAGNAGMQGAVQPWQARLGTGQRRQNEWASPPAALEMCLDTGRIRWRGPASCSEQAPEGPEWPPSEWLLMSTCFHVIKTSEALCQERQPWKASLQDRNQWGQSAIIFMTLFSTDFIGPFKLCKRANRSYTGSSFLG